VGKLRANDKVNYSIIFRLSSVSKYFVILTCRNSQEIIKTALSSIQHQIKVPEFVIVINDGSSDKTKSIVEDMQKNWPSLYLINNPDLGYDISRVVKNWNAAIRFARQLEYNTCDYHMIATDDTIYPPGYAEKMTTYLDLNPLVAIVSGGYNKYASVPTGAGRFVRNSFFERTAWRGYYPEQMGYESAMLYEARRRGYRHQVIENIRFKHTRPLGGDHMFFEFGASMRTLGYHPVFAFARFLKYFTTGQVTTRKGALYMLYYYLTYRPAIDGYHSMYNDEIRRYVRSNQVKRLRHVLFIKCKRLSKKQ
jgi:glycosyltransferase involved in cell wall biosynthesis